MLGFMIVGAQRCGTTALARFLSRHPGVAMSSPKEVHLFDGANYSSDWTSEQIDARYRRAFTEGADGRIRGEATPVYLFFPETARELRRYNPRTQADRAPARPRRARDSRATTSRSAGARNEDRYGSRCCSSPCGCGAATIRARAAR